MELNRDELDALLGAYAVDALDDDERDELERLIDTDQELAAEARRMQEAAMGLVDGFAADGAVPASLLDGVLARAVSARAPGRHLANPLGSALPPVELWQRQLAELDAVLDGLGDDDWGATTSFDRPVRDLLAHLSAVLEQFATELGAGSFQVPADAGFDHWLVTEPHIAALTARPPADTVAALRDVGERITSALAATKPEDLDALDATSPISIADRTRQQSFELWMHTDDVRRATGLPMLDPDPERICALSDLSARFLGFGMLAAGRDHPGRRGRLVLTGPGGGTWTTPLTFEEAAAGGPDDVVVVADAIDYCRMAGKLLRIDELAVEVEGDATLALDLLSGAQAFAV